MTNTYRRSRPDAGFSVVELVIVMTIIILMVGLSVFALSPAKRGSLVDDAALQFTRFARDGSMLALSQRQRHRLVVNRSTADVDISGAKNGATQLKCPASSMVIVDEGTTIANDERLVRLEPLVDSKQVRIGKPGNVTTQPSAPFNFSEATFTSDVWETYFNSGGTVTNSSSVPQSVTFYFYPPQATGTNVAEKSFTRAVTIFGPSGVIKYWRYTVEDTWVIK